MKHSIDINLIKENPQIFFKQLDENAEKEFISLLEYFVFKYDIKFDFEINSDQKKVGGILEKFSNPSLINEEKDIWEQVIKDKHENH